MVGGRAVRGGRVRGGLVACLRARRGLMPGASYGEGYYPRFRADGSVVPWRLDDVNKQRQEDSQARIPAT